MTTFIIAIIGIILVVLLRAKIDRLFAPEQRKVETKLRLINGRK